MTCFIGSATIETGDCYSDINHSKVAALVVKMAQQGQELGGVSCHHARKEPLWTVLDLGGPATKQLCTPVQVHLQTDDAAVEETVVSALVVQLTEISFGLSCPVRTANIRYVTALEDP